MAFTLQNSDGTVSNANAYVSPADLRSFALERGVDLTSTLDAALEVAIIKATDFLDAAYSFVGHPKNDDQGTAWPRLGITYTNQRGLPAALLKACKQLALRAAQGTSLSVDPTVDPSGQTVSASTVKVGPIEKSTQFATPSGGVQGVSSGALSRRFPDVELGLRQAKLLGGNSGGVTIGQLQRA